jgi:hypothetical protein
MVRGFRTEFLRCIREFDSQGDGSCGTKTALPGKSHFVTRVLSVKQRVLCCHQRSTVMRDAGCVQLYHYLNHFNLFGGGYYRTSVSLLSALNSEFA